MSYLNRTLCDVLEELRKAYDTRNFSYMLALIEEAQSMGNRMESGLGDIRQLEGIREDIKKLDNQKKELKKKVAKLKKAAEPEEKKNEFGFLEE